MGGGKSGGSWRPSVDASDGGLKLHATYVLPVIPEPAANTMAILVADKGMRGPFLKMNGHIDLCCGSCGLILGEGLHPGTLVNIVLKCAQCDSYNAVPSIPSLRAFIEVLRNTPEVDVPKLASVLSQAKELGGSPEAVLTAIGKTPGLSWFRQVVLPTDAGQFWAFIAALVAFLTWYQSYRAGPAEPTNVTINNYFQVKTAPSDSQPQSGASNVRTTLPGFHSPKTAPNARPRVGRNEPCPCGSMVKYKKCHGAPPSP